MVIRRVSTADLNYVVRGNRDSITYVSWLFSTYLAWKRVHATEPTLGLSSFHSFTFVIFTDSTRDAQASVSDTAAEPAANGDKRRSPRSRASIAEASWRSTASKQGPRSLLRQMDFNDLERAARVAESSVVPARFQDCAHENET